MVPKCSRRKGDHAGIGFHQPCDDAKHLPKLLALSETELRWICESKGKSAERYDRMSGKINVLSREGRSMIVVI